MAKSKKRIQMGEVEWEKYQVERKRKKSREYIRRKSIIFNGRRIKDISDLRSGNLVAVRPVDPKEYGNSDIKSVYWECKCDCGGKIIARTSRITGKEYISCGCMRVNGKAKRGYKTKENRAKPNEFYKNISVTYYNRIKAKAAKRNIIFKVNIEYLDEIFKRQNGCCAFTGDKLCFETGEKISKTTASLDRINSSIGYVEGNLQWVHKDVNMLKGRMKDDSLFRFCRRYGEVVEKIRTHINKGE